MRKKTSTLATPVLAGAMDSPVYLTYPLLRLHSDRLVGTCTPFHPPQGSRTVQLVFSSVIILAHVSLFCNSLFARKQIFLFYPSFQQKGTGPERACAFE